MSGFFLADMVRLLRTGAAHDPRVVYFYIVANLLMNVLNLYWLSAMLGQNWTKGQVLSEATGGEIVGAKWFAFNLSWFDVGVTMSFGEAWKPQIPTPISKSNPNPQPPTRHREGPGPAA